MSEAVEFKLQPRHRALADIAIDLARADADIEALRGKLKTVTLGYKVQIESAKERLARLREEHLQAAPNELEP